MSDRTAILRGTERWFYRRGLPFFVEDYRSSTDVWTRASPFLAAMFVLLVIVGAMSFDDVAGALGGLALAVALLGGYAAWNVRHGRRWRALPERVTWPVLAAFVAVPALVALAASRTLTALIEAAVVAALLLGLAWFITRYAVIPLCGWAVRYTFRGVYDLYRMATRALPLMLLFITFLFINTEVWQVAGTLGAARLWLVIAIFVALGVVFIIGRVPQEVRLIESATDSEQVVAACERTPLAGVVSTLEGLGTPIGLNRRQQANIGLVMTVAQLVQVALFATVVWAFFVLFGALTVSVDLQVSWLGALAPVDVVWAWGEGYGVTRQLLRVATFLGAFAGFYVTIYTATDSAYREQFYDRIRQDLERSLSVRRAYVVLHRRGD